MNSNGQDKINPAPDPDGSMPDRRRDNRNAADQQHQREGTASLHPAVITGPTHAVVLATSLLQNTRTAIIEAMDQRLAEDLYMAAANVECAAMYLHIAEAIIKDYPDEEVIQIFTKTQIDLLATRRQVIDDDNPFPLYEETVIRLQTQQQAFLNLAQLKEIKTILNTQGQYLPDWNEDLREAYVAVAHYFGHQPPFCEFQDTLNPRPDFAHKAEAARTNTAGIADEITAAYEEKLPVRFSPATESIQGLNTQPFNQPHSPALPQFGLNFIDHSPARNGPVNQCTAYMTFIHQGVKYVKALDEPYPKGFPQDLAKAYAHIARTTLPRVMANTKTITNFDHASTVRTLHHMQDAADLGIHNAGPSDFQAALKSAKDAKLPKGVRANIIEAITDYNEDLADIVLQDSTGSWRKRASKRQALNIIHTASQEGIDPHTLAAIAKALGFTRADLHISQDTITRQQLDTVLETMEKAGFPKEVATRVIEHLV